ncbi:Paired box protein Pax-8 [Stylophora pistillata]|uniref:Paired box protein Pax-8 n=1 Tax=Stylophora pistillata TaxID=50429 RepID=A0A2B4RCC0_STYPI|nr:Paired box protein Pax-8 [Stylophora pistillata]
MQLCRNEDGKLYDNGRSYPKLLREGVLDLNHDGMSQRAIARKLRASRCFIQNVLADYDHTGSSLQHLRDPTESRIRNAQVISCIEREKLMKPSVYEAVNLIRADGSALLERGDTVIMDNCGFHHGHFMDPILTTLLANCGVRLLFPPPYSPEFNTYEPCFHDIKEFLRRYQRLAEEETAYAIY